MAIYSDDYYSVLNLHHDCDHFDITIAYNKLMETVMDEKKFQEIQTAWEVLNDLDSRQKYDDSFLWDVRARASLLDKQQREKAHRTETMCSSLSHMSLSQGGKHPLHAELKERGFAYDQKHREMIFQRTKMEHQWARADSDSERLRLIKVANSMAQRIFKDIKKMVSVAQVRFAELDRENFGDSNISARTHDIQALLQEATELSKSSKTLIDKLGKGDAHHRPVLGERSAKKAQAWKPSQELAYARGLDQQMAQVRKNIHILVEVRAIIYSVIEGYQLQLISDGN